MVSSEVKLWKYAFWLAVFTVVYNLAEGIFSLYFGLQDEALTLFGFGIDSFVEVLSGLGILAMVLRITGFSFFILAAGLTITAIYNLISGHKPETTLPGLIISLISIAMMWALVWSKRKVGRALNSAPILADAQCTLVCIYMSLVLLASSLIYLLTGFGLFDSLGALGLVYFSIHEGRESFEKANSLTDECCEEDVSEVK